MNCEQIQARMIEASSAEREALSEHLAECPECASMNRAIEQFELNLQNGLDAFGTKQSLDEAWAHASAAVPPARGQWVQRGAVLLAAAATLAFTVWQFAPSSVAPGSLGIPPDGAEFAIEQHQAFEALTMNGIVSPDMTSKEQQSALKEALGTKVAALLATERAYRDLIESNDPLLEFYGLRSLGEMKISMAESIREMDRPTGMPEGQLAAFEASLQEATEVQYVEALAVWEQAASLAADLGDTTAEAEVQELIDELKTQVHPEGVYDPEIHDEVAVGVEIAFVPSSALGSLEEHLAKRDVGVLYGTDQAFELPASARVVSDTTLATTWNNQVGNFQSVVGSDTSRLSVLVKPTRRNGAPHQITAKITLGDAQSWVLQSDLAHSHHVAVLEIEQPQSYPPIDETGWLVVSLNVD